MATKLEIAGKHVWNVCIALDQLANTVLGGDSDDTVCSHAAKRMHASRLWGAFAAGMERLDPGHMQRSAEHGCGKDSISEFIARKRRKKADCESEGDSPPSIVTRLVMWMIMRAWRSSMTS
ncbi:hypothetical protein ACFSQT_14255 [Mesorhizobium calcicola]|uniref:Uncharacterized protein n=1 Tax=Mesorhizobium calcicola TaxID=1300310 RepID=A0ABW4WC33_9HYPH